MTKFDHLSLFLEAINSQEIENIYNRLDFPNADDTLALARLGIIGSFDYDYAGRRCPFRVSWIEPLERNRFEISKNGKRAAIVKVFDWDDCCIDLLALDMETRWTGCLLGRLGIIGDGLYTANLGAPLLAHRNAASWLASKREGIVILDPIQARSILMDYIGPQKPLVVADHHYAKRLKSALEWRPAIEVNPKAFKTWGAAA